MTSLMVSMTAFIAGIKDRFGREEKGATMVEYGIMVALIAVVVIVAIGPLGIAIRGMFQNITAGI
ncbi:pilus assembly protein Flp/PilA [Arthrobacter sp. SLBN-83]|uniref:Flp family type IVb pilin n=1 Tax=Arthrobacter sp. SLBN-83 TaxID=2768449 RepID=UPI00114E57BC|nr:Flp family type IVb pilin [Arthrobacter sp. SLBN-83]TQJ60228.1 pilus assembly protein Flp/PilA [Arthrobacter sp. SLBN-83]